MSEVRQCKCVCEGQDALHGAGNRVHNRTSKDTFRCTSCGSENGGSAPKGKKK